MNLSLAVAIMDENLKGPTATFDEMGLSAVRWAWQECKAALTGRTNIEGVKPSAYLKFWWADQCPRCRVDLTEVCEPWLDALSPQIVPLYAGDDLQAAFATALSSGSPPVSPSEASAATSVEDAQKPSLPLTQEKSE